MTAADTAPHAVRGARSRTAEFWAGVLVALVGGAGLVGALKIFVPMGLNDYLGPRLIPITVSALVIVLGLALMLRTLLRGPTFTTDPGSLRTLAVLLAITAVYLLLFGLLGFLLATVCFLAATFVYLGESRLWVALLAAAVVATLVTLAFTHALNVALPVGPLGV